MTEGLMVGKGEIHCKLEKVNIADQDDCIKVNSCIPKGIGQTLQSHITGGSLDLRTRVGTILHIYNIAGIV